MFLLNPYENMSKEKIDELREQLKEFELDYAKKLSAAHRSVFEHWEEGEITKVWRDKENNLCIEYESGKFWHYSDNGEWW